MPNVTLNNAPTKQKLFRFVEKKIHQWALTRLGDLSAGEMEFNVSFNEESEVKQVSCTTEIHLGGHIWRGSDLASDTQQALLHSLKRLHENL